MKLPLVIALGAVALAALTLPQAALAGRCKNSTELVRVSVEPAARTLLAGRRYEAVLALQQAAPGSISALELRLAGEAIASYDVPLDEEVRVDFRAPAAPELVVTARWTQSSDSVSKSGVRRTVTCSAIDSHFYRIADPIGVWGRYHATFTPRGGGVKGERTWYTAPLGSCDRDGCAFTARATNLPALRFSLPEPGRYRASVELPSNVFCDVKDAEGKLLGRFRFSERRDFTLRVVESTRANGVLRATRLAGLERVTTRVVSRDPDARACKDVQRYVFTAELAAF